VSAGPLAPGVWLGGCQIEALLGQGGMGVVYRARDAQGQVVALKVLRPGPDVDERLVRRFEREGKAAARVSHPNVARVFGAGADRGFPFIVMELLPGGTLGQRIKKSGPLPWKEAATLTAKVARGLAAIHAAGIVHRDMKPENVLLDASGEPRVSDFGLARHTDAGLSRGGLTKTGEILGTYEYMSPEQADGAKDVDARADLYSLGASLHATLTGSAPFQGSGYALLTKVLTDKAPSVRASVAEVPRELDALVARLLEKAREDRPGSAEAVAVELEAIARGVGRGRRAPVAVALALAALGAGALALTRGHPDVAPPPPKVAPPKPPAKPRAPARSFPAICQGFLVGDRRKATLTDFWGSGAAAAPVRPFRGLAKVVKCLALSKDGRRGFAAGEAGALAIWDLASGAEIHALTDRDKPVAINALALMPGEARVMTAHYGGGLDIWEIESGELLTRVPWPVHNILSVAVARDGTHFLAGSDDQVASGDVTDGEPPVPLEVPGASCYRTSIAYSPDEKRAIVAGNHNSLFLVDVAARRFEGWLLGHEPVEGETTLTAAFAPDSKHALSGDSEGVLSYWDVTTRTPIRILKPHTKGVARVAVFPDGGHAISTSADGTILLWDVASWTTLDLVDLTSIGDWPSALAVAADGGSFCVGTYEGRVLRFEVAW
jgi:serine/threonine-protein kinase